ncbi:DUF1643 domain-containing protein [Mycobacterium sp. TY813]|uniref:DUF1643 domain-containing protein n=1 Tax=Mycobacterium TaxID=1763 RepID=UPI0027407934|nr:DUF1643 domain-containing protein [Mycobacterium sp. TY813]MDP7729528.1 DUF1643 domain-containing protein [Mycobacterium sp. TY813]
MTEQLAIDVGPESGAVISPCGTYQYRLWRRWDHTKPMIGWVMLNPSTADANTDDPTIRRCKGFARDWGFGGIIVRNLFALRSTAPAALDTHPEPIGPRNDAELTGCSEQNVTVMAWGTFAPRKRASAVARLLWDIYAQRPGSGRLAVLGWTASHMPRHPLYVPAATQPEYCDWTELFDA